MQNYNPLAPFSKGDFVKSPLIKGDIGGCVYTIKHRHVNYYHFFLKFVTICVHLGVIVFFLFTFTHHLCPDQPYLLVRIPVSQFLLYRTQRLHTQFF